MKTFLEIDLINVVNGEEGRYIDFFSNNFSDKFRGAGATVYFLKNKLDYKNRREQITVDDEKDIVCFTVITVEVNNDCSIDLFASELNKLLLEFQFHMPVI
jgi:hypothetical protein